MSFAFFITFFLRSNGMSYLTASVIRAAEIYAIIAGILFNLESLTILLSPNLNRLLLENFSMCLYPSYKSDWK